MSLSRELDYLEGSLTETDLLFIEQLTRSAESKRFERVSEFVHSAAARGWRVRLKALRRHPDYHALLKAAPAPPQVTWVPLAELITLKGGLNPRERPKAALTLPWYKIAHFITETHIMQVKRASEHSLKITAREEHGALKPYDILSISKSGHLGFYLRPHTLPISSPREPGELTHTSFVKLSAESLDSRVIHPAFLTAFLTSAEGIEALIALQRAKGEPAEGELDWSLNIKELGEVLIPVCSPLRQALMISAWALRVELQRQQRRYLEEVSRLEASKVSEMFSPSSPTHKPLRSRDAYDQLLSDLIQPFDEDGPLRPLPLDEAPLFPTLGRHMALRALTRHLMSLSDLQSAQRWRALHVMTLGHLCLLDEHGDAHATEDLRQRALNQQCVGLCSAALNQLNRHLLVVDPALQLPRHNPEPWFYFTPPSEGERPDLVFVFWGHPAALAPSLGEALEVCDPLVSSNLEADRTSELVSVLQISMDEHFVQSAFYAQDLGGYLDFSAWEVYLLVYRVRALTEASLASQGIFFSSLGRLCPRSAPPSLHPTPDQRWARPLKGLIEAISPKYSFHLEHLTELRTQLTELIDKPH